MMVDEITVYPTRGHLLRIGDEYYKLAREKKGEDGRVVIEAVYEKVDPEKYISQVRKLADELDKRTSISLKAIVEDALKDLPLERVASIGEQLKQDKKRLDAVRVGGCVELNIGNEHLVLRE